MKTSSITPSLSAALLAVMLSVMLSVSGPAHAADEAAKKDEKPANEQVIVPQVDRRDVRVPKIPANDIELGLFVGSYATENFGTSTVSGVRLGYHITEDFFVEGAYGRTKVSDENYRQVFPSGIFPTPEQRLTYYNLSAGVNLLPGEVFFMRNWAKVSTLYFIGGVGSTKFFDQKKQTFNIGFGSRVFFADWMALQVDVRNHIFSIDILGERRNTQNIELTVGATFFF
jgi:outer membrane beta-barrel protein